MGNAKTLVGVHTYTHTHIHTHTGYLKDKIITKKEDREIMLVLEFDTS